MILFRHLFIQYCCFRLFLLFKLHLSLEGFKEYEGFKISVYESLNG